MNPRTAAMIGTQREAKATLTGVAQEQTSALAIDVLAYKRSPVAVGRRRLADVERAFSLEIGKAQEQARGRSVRELAKEMKAIGLRLPPAPPQIFREYGAAVRDAEAKSLASSWLKSVAVTNWEEPGAVLGVGGRMRGPLGRVADDVVGGSYDDARHEYEPVLAKAYPELRKRWDACGCIGTCGQCSDMAGHVVALGVEFPGGIRPAYVHNRCKCTTSFVLG